MFKAGDLVTPLPTEDSGWYTRGLLIAEIIKILNKYEMHISIVVQNNNMYEYNRTYTASIGLFKLLGT